MNNIKRRKILSFIFFHEVLETDSESDSVNGSASFFESESQNKIANHEERNIEQFPAA